MKETYMTIERDGEEIEVLIEYEVTSHGSPGTGPSFSHPGDPPEAPEYEIHFISDCDGKPVELTEGELEKLDEAVCLEIAENVDDYPEDV